ncbi:MAG TPA: DUF4062 domain-containing protein [Blastocatellia bacterium]|nr:DUF4062 domain-containing protein [Blastocatellia bacterium]
MPNILKVMISSTARDLPDHRKQMVEACLRQDMFPLRMEDLPANSDEAVKASLRMAEEADVYIGVFANRYGYVPEANNPDQISVTEMEYNRAAARGIERLIFVMDKSHPITVEDVEIENAAKLKSFKERVQAENIVRFFKSPDDLRAEAVNSLSKLRQPDLTTFHYISDIPEPPEAFIAHPYTLLQAHRLVGRQQELNLLTDWVTRKRQRIYQAHILNIVAIGGLGKSALTWKWFNDIAPQEMNPLAGRMWWSFYESDATFENFVTRALAYTTQRSLEEVQKIPAPERETQLLAALDREPFLIVLDGLERILIAYARMDAARLEDSQVSNQRNLRKTADPRAGRFLKKLAQIKNSRILASTRLYPAELETEGGDPIPGCFKHALGGLTGEDAVELWRALGISGSRDLLLPVFNAFDKHPLLIQALAGEVKRYRKAPGDFEEWRKAHPRFDPTKFERLQDAMNHVLEFALRGLNDKALKALQVVAAFRMPARYDTLSALLIGEGKACIDEQDIDKVLTELEDRGLVGWDKRANRYDLHPIVRGVVWGSLSDDIKRGVYTSLHTHFEAFPKIGDWKKVGSLEDLTPTIELYGTLIGLGRYDDAIHLFVERLQNATLYRLSASRQMTELMEMLFPDGADQPPRLSNVNRQAYTLHMLAIGYKLSGQIGNAVTLYRRANAMILETNDNTNLSVGLRSLSNTLRLSGALYESESAVCRALIISAQEGNRYQESASLFCIGLTLATRGLTSESNSALQRSLRIQIARLHSQGEGIVNFYLTQSALWLGKFANALLFANRAWELAHVENNEGDFISAARVQGEAALGLNNFATADERLHHALTRARAVNLVEEELPTLIALAELRRRQDDLKTARELLDDVWEPAECGPYPLFHADACNVLAQIERDAGNLPEAVEAATRAYKLAWCDGPPFAYHWGLEKARKHLRELGAPEPDMPPFDQSKFEPMPEVEIDPEDEFHAGN